LKWLGDIGMEVLIILKNGTRYEFDHVQATKEDLLSALNKRKFIRFGPLYVNVGEIVTIECK
jgi:hypothetical protein